MRLSRPTLVHEVLEENNHGESGFGWMCEHDKEKKEKQRTKSPPDRAKGKEQNCY